LLDAEQQRDFMDFLLDTVKQISHDMDSPDTPYAPVSLPTDPTALREFEDGTLYVSPEQQLVTVQGQTIDLTAKEFDALHLLILNSPRVLTFERIALEVWGEEYIDTTDKVIHNLMSHLRHKLQITPDIPEYVVNVRGIGYKFSVEKSSNNDDQIQSETIDNRGKINTMG
jgi:two-component system response regulator RegX3